MALLCLTCSHAGAAARRYAVFPEDGDLAHLRAAVFVLQSRQEPQPQAPLQQQPQDPAFNFAAAEAARAASGGGGGALGIREAVQPVGGRPRAPSVQIISPTEPRDRATQVPSERFYRINE